MEALSSFLALINQAIISRKSTVFVARSLRIEKISLFLEEKGYFSSVIFLPKKIKITIRYSMNRAPFYRLVLVSKSSKRVYINSRVTTSGIFLVTNSEFGFVLRHAENVTGGKVLFRIL
jgi:ribosomal protein S8